MKYKNTAIAIMLALPCAVAYASNNIDEFQIDKVVVNGDGNDIGGLSPCTNNQICENPDGYSWVIGNENYLQGLSNYMVTGNKNNITFTYNSSMMYPGFTNSVNIYGNSNSADQPMGLNIFGSSNKVLGQNLDVVGYGNNVSGSAVQVMGTGNELNMVGMGAFIGSKNKIDNYAGSVIGTFNTLSGGSYALTIGTLNTITSSPIGGSELKFGNITLGTINTITDSDESIVIGNYNTVQDSNAIVIGNYASASNGGIAIGDGSVTNMAGTVSFGSSSVQRILTNVADGVSRYDAVNYGQLMSSVSSLQTYTDNAISSYLSSSGNGSGSGAGSDTGSTPPPPEIGNDNNSSVGNGSGSDQTTADANTYTDQLIASESASRISGDAQTLLSANNHTNAREAVINSRTDLLVDSERQSRIDGDRQTLASANSYTNQKFSDLKKTVDRNDKRAKAGSASAIAIASIPFLNNVSGFGMAMGAYRDQGAISGGANYAINEKVNVRFSMSADTTGGIGAGAGFAVGFQ